MIHFITEAKYFYISLLFIVLFGAYLRFIDYASVPPFQDTADEFVYPLAGLSWIQTGTPIGWANTDVYQSSKKIDIWGTWYRLVKPWFEKPPLFTLLSGGFMHLTGAKNFTDLRLETMRLVPIFLGLLTIFLIGMIGKKIGGVVVGLLGAIIYATDPFIVLANRLNLTESLLQPLMLLSLIWVLKSHFLSEENLENKKSTIILCILSSLSLLTKQLGVAIPLTVFIFFISKKQWANAIAIVASSTLAVGIYLTLAWNYGWEIFINSIKSYGAHANGLPELIQSIFRYPIITNRHELFPDGLILLGYILFFSAPWWLQKKDRIILYFPFTYLTLLAILESANDSNPFFYGWHLFPFFPFLAILIALAVKEVWKYGDKTQAWFIGLITMLSSVRFWLISFPEYQPKWQIILIIIFALIGLAIIIKEKIALTLIAILVLITNVMVVFNLGKIYGKRIQPKEEYVIPLQGLL